MALNSALVSMEKRVNCVQEKASLCGEHRLIGLPKGTYFRDGRETGRARLVGSGRHSAAGQPAVMYFAVGKNSSGEAITAVLNHPGLEPGDQITRTDQLTPTEILSFRLKEQRPAWPAELHRRDTTAYLSKSCSQSSFSRAFKYDLCWNERGRSAARSGSRAPCLSHLPQDTHARLFLLAPPILQQPPGKIYR